MRCTCQPDEKHRGPVLNPCDKKYGEETKGKNKETGFTRARHGPATLCQISGKPAAEKAKHRDDRINTHEVDPAFLDIKSACFFEIVGKPYQEKPPYGVSHKLGDDKGPRLTILQQTEPG